MQLHLRRLLYYLLAFLVLAFAEFVWIECETNYFGFDRQNWLFAIATFSALVGWIVTSVISLRNSTKQHTINTLLQSRLSAPFNQHALELNKVFESAAVKAEDITDATKADGIRAMKYMLNYHEFIAVGIRSGDLDHDVVKNSLRGIIVSLYDQARVYIEPKRAADKRKFEHLAWLYEKWRDKSRKPGKAR